MKPLLALTDDSLDQKADLLGNTFQFQERAFRCLSAFYNVKNPIMRRGKDYELVTIARQDDTADEVTLQPGVTL